MSMSRCLVSRRFHPMCGVRMTLSIVYSGLSIGGGSTSCTSKPAPAMVPAFRAAIRSSSLMTGPRAVLIMKAVGFIFSKAALSMRCLVSALRGQWRLTKSLRGSSSSTVVISMLGLPLGFGFRLEIMTFMPRATAMSATLLPMPPLPPMRPSVFPPSSKCGTCRHFSKFERSPLQSIRCCATREELKFITKVMTMCATASLL
mmetsp:Transcript_37333/g.68891  ORF Transcript_37333/g.68891 Transcript_37333/m.68891 type:complete len:202 (+) Transcript_37333:134-739(+)